MNDQKPFFVPITIMVVDLPPELNQECMHCEAFPDEAIAKVDDFCHRRLGIPVNWLLCRSSLERMKESLRVWHDEFGDEVGIYEFGIVGRNAVRNGLQNWVERAGISRSGDEMRPWSVVSEEEIFRAMTLLRAEYSRELGFAPTFVYGANGGDAMVRALKRAGIPVMWGYNWNLYGDGVDATGRGVLPDPFFVNSANAKAPAEPGDTSLLGVPWGTGDFCNVWQLPRQSRIAINNVCLNPHELANRSGAVPEFEYVETFIARAAKERDWNPYAYVPLQCEAVWLDESGNFYAHHPEFPTRATECFFHEIQTARRHGASFVGFGEVYEWFRARFDRTARMVHVCEDLVPGAMIRGKDHRFSDVVVYGSADRQVIFEKERGFNPVRTYSYVPVAAGMPPNQEYPGKNEPEVELKVQEWISPAFGVQLSASGACYKVSCGGSPGFRLTAHRAEPDYHCIFWHLHLPEYVGKEDLVFSANIRDFEIIRSRDIGFLTASLEQGTNVLECSSSLPGRYLSLEAPRLSGRRCEICIHNSGAPVGLTALEVDLEPGLQLGGFWWNGYYYNSFYHFDYSPYDPRTGKLFLRTAYPNVLPLSSGLNRCVLEVLGTFQVSASQGERNLV